MNEFIVWDKKSKQFRCPKVFVFDTNSKHDINKEHKLNLVQCWGEPFYGYMDEESNPDVWIKREGKQYEVFSFIGLKDINGKNIYANSSIVEFTASGSHGYTQIKGYFHFLKEDLKYIIKTFTHGSFDFNKKLYKNFKVIDSIQENKLGLIK